MRLVVSVAWVIPQCSDTSLTVNLATISEAPLRVNFIMQEESDMLRLTSLFIAVASLAIAFLAVPSTSHAAGLPEGVTIEVLAEYPSETPGVEKILFRKITLKPGASWSLTVPAQSLCQGTKGVLEVDDQTSGETFTFKAGDRWYTSPGHKVTLSNKGTVDHEHLFYTMVVK